MCAIFYVFEGIFSSGVSLSYKKSEKIFTKSYVLFPKYSKKFFQTYWILPG